MRPGQRARITRLGPWTTAAVLVATVWLTPTAPTTAADRRGQAMRHVEKGLDSLREGRLDAAQASFEKGAAVDEISPEPYDGLGQVALKRGQYEAALRQFLTARELYQLGASSRAREEVEYAMRFQQTRQAYTDITGEMSQAGCLQENSFRLRSHGGNRDLEDRAATAPPTLETLPAGLCFRTGVCLLRLGRPDLARSEFLNELQVNPASRAARINLALCELSLGDPRSALVSLDEAIRLGASEPEGLRAEIVARLDAAGEGGPEPAATPSQEDPPELP